MTERQWAVAMVPGDTDKGPLVIGEGCAQATGNGFTVFSIVPAFLPFKTTDPKPVYAIVCYKDVEVEEKPVEELPVERGE